MARLRDVLRLRVRELLAEGTLTEADAKRIRRELRWANPRAVLGGNWRLLVKGQAALGSYPPTLAQHEPHPEETR
jgi:hypothetical protein